MKQIVLPLPEALVSEIQWLAQHDGCPEAEIVRDGLGMYLTLRRIARQQVSELAPNRSIAVSDDDQYRADLAEPYR
jgi:hypothetical protein